MLVDVQVERGAAAGAAAARAAVADSAAEELAVDVHAQPHIGHGLVVVAIVRVSIAVAFLALKRVVPLGSSIFSLEKVLRFIQKTLSA